MPPEYQDTVATRSPSFAATTIANPSGDGSIEPFAAIPRLTTAYSHPCGETPPFSSVVLITGFPKALKFCCQTRFASVNRSPLDGAIGDIAM